MQFEWSLKPILLKSVVDPSALGFSHPHTPRGVSGKNEESRGSLVFNSQLQSHPCSLFQPRAAGLEKPGRVQRVKKPCLVVADGVIRGRRSRFNFAP